MQKIITFLIMMFLGTSVLQAYNVKGLKAYKKLCIQCHGGPFKGAAMHTVDEWEEIIENSKTPFLDFHKNIPDAMSKFERSLSERRRQYLFIFLIDNAKDSGVAPGCDGNYCGQD